MASGLIWVLVAAVAYHALGALWYSPVLFGNRWMKLVGLTPERIDEARKRGMTGAYLSGFVCALGVSFALWVLMLAGGIHGLWGGLLTAFVAATGFIATTHLPSYFFRSLPLELYFMDTGYHFVGTLLAGLLLGAFAR